MSDIENAEEPLGAPADGAVGRSGTDQVACALPSSVRAPLLCGSLALSLLLLATVSAKAGILEEGDIVTGAFGFYTYHVSNDEKLNGAPWMFGVEWEKPSRWGSGLAFFQNSFGQPSGYLYAQKRYTWSGGDEGWFLKITGGLLYGYRPPHEHAVPFNRGGFSPGLVPIVGYKKGRATAEIVVFGASSGFVATLGYDLWK